MSSSDDSVAQSAVRHSTLDALRRGRTVIHGFVPIARSIHYRPSLRARSIVRVDSLCGAARVVFTCVDIMEGIKKKELVSIGELNTSSREMTKLTKKDAPTLALEENSGVGRHELPRCLEKLDGKDYFFQIRFTPYNFTPKPLNQTTVVDSEGGQATASASNTVVTAKIATGVKEPNPSNGS
ncbi:hypothetical protein DY000_02007990 [Brassica cretica]|uniref:Uncharacterized protein n=1 Tax=Brassica cretica TaxID=69181 RepID=A0ABQ7C5M2_BRACR|nr:hypothetical protein DY000_02007990 [Brassica cretica]